MKTSLLACLVALASTSSLACSGSSFDVVAGDDAASESSVDGSSEAGGDETAVDTGVPEGCTLNACGGCTVLDHDPGSSCGGICGAARWTCKGYDAVECVDPFSGPLPKAKCGTCKTMEYACEPDGKSAKCSGEDANACGGCMTLSPAKGDACGVCGGGTYGCNGTEATKCDDPVAADKAPEKACGACSTGKYACDGVGKTKCVDPVTHAPSTACGVCGSGQWACGGAGGDTKCNDPVTVAIGTVCGTCGTSTYQCTGSTPGSKTACLKEDDRKLSSDAFYSTFDTQVFTLSPAAPHMIGFTMQRIGAISDVELGILRFDSSPSSLYGSLTIRLLRDTPTSTDVLATLSYPAELLPATLATVKLTLPAPTPVLPKGTRVYIEVSDTSGRYNFAIMGGAPTGPAHLSAYYKDSTSGTFVEYSTSDPYLKIYENGCF